MQYRICPLYIIQLKKIAIKVLIVAFIYWSSNLIVDDLAPGYTSLRVATNIEHSHSHSKPTIKTSTDDLKPIKTVSRKLTFGVLLFAFADNVENVKEQYLLC